MGQGTLQTINDLTRQELKAALGAMGEPGYRATQIAEWLYGRRAKTFDEMTNLSLALRAELKRRFQIVRLAKRHQTASARDGAVKFALELADGHLIETVFLPRARGATLCISSQAGCAFGCRFCATGRMGFRRNLSPGEIVDQVGFAIEHLTAHPPGPSGASGPPGGGRRAEDKGARERGSAEADLAEEPEAEVPAEREVEAAPEAAAQVAGQAGGEPDEEPAAEPDGEPGAGAWQASRPFGNIVLMGMGEPLANYDSVMRAVEILTKEMGIGSRRITISTVGLPDRIRRLAEAPGEVGLALSVNAADDDTRRQLMPVAGRTPLAEIMAAARHYFQKKGRILTFEYVLMAGANDRTRDAHALANLTREVPAKINLIALNPFPGCPYARPDAGTIGHFQAVLRERGRNATLRRSLGSDILAGCGQLGARLTGATAPAIPRPSSKARRVKTGFAGRTRHSGPDARPSAPSKTPRKTRSGRSSLRPARPRRGAKQTRKGTHKQRGRT